MAFFFRNMNVLGLNAEYFRQGPSDAHIAEALLNRRFRGHVKQRQYQGQTKNEVDRFFTAGGLTAGTPVNPEASLPQVSPPPVAAAPPPAPAPAAPPAAVPPAPAPAPQTNNTPAPPVVQAKVPDAPVPPAAPPAVPVSVGEAVQASGNGGPPPPPFVFAPDSNEVCA
jgi:hypothetical protein